ncbi:hypothetical protein ACGF0D_43015 [Kitasatospora sp. NPDC048298]|uniref:hypothetical protein n=1 Tax=Kitasatospora sp. NPDC048298 TaxID=3364049 RepID=UPI003710F781
MSAADFRRVQPAFQALRPSTVRRIGIEAEERLLPAMVTQDPAPLASAAWQMAIAFRSIGDLMEAEGGDHEALAVIGEDVADRLLTALEEVHRHVGRRVPAEKLAKRTFERFGARVETGQAAIGAATVEVVLPEGELAATVHVGQERPDAPVQIRGDVTAGQLDGTAHLGVLAALSSLAEALTPYLSESAARPL